jgi:hypothetical protein
MLVTRNTNRAASRGFGMFNLQQFHATLADPRGYCT